MICRIGLTVYDKLICTLFTIPHVQYIKIIIFIVFYQNLRTCCLWNDSPFLNPIHSQRINSRIYFFFLTGYPISLRKMYYTRKKWFANHNSGSFFFPLLNTTDFWLNIMLHLENIEVKWLSLLTLAFPCRWMEDNGSAVVGIIYTHASMQICYPQKYQPNTPSQSLKWP